MQSQSKVRELCRVHGLAATHQRVIIYRAVTARPGHYSPEDVYNLVRRQIPSISLATVYKNLKKFVAHGMLRELHPGAGPLRVDPTLERHHHLVCTRCGAVRDVASSWLVPVRARRPAPRGFRVREFKVDALGLCRKCARKRSPRSRS